MAPNIENTPQAIQIIKATPIEPHSTITPFKNKVDSKQVVGKIAIFKFLL